MRNWRITIGVILVIVVAGVAGYALGRLSAKPAPTPVAAEHTTPQMSSTVQVDTNPVAPSMPSMPVPSTPTTPSTGKATPKGTMPQALPQPGAMPQTGAPHGDNSAMRPKFELLRLFRGIGRLAVENETPLTAKQAKQILAVMNPLHTKKSLSADEATKAKDKLEGILTVDQKKTLAQIPRGGMRGGMGRPPMGDNPHAGSATPGTQNPHAGMPGTPPAGGMPPMGSGNGQPGGGRPQMDPKVMETMNPFNLDDSNPMTARMKDRVDEVYKALEVKAK